MRFQKSFQKEIHLFLLDKNFAKGSNCTSCYNLWQSV